MRSVLRPMVKYGPQTPGHPVVSISERMRLLSGNHAYGTTARPLIHQIKDGDVLEYIHFKPFQHFRIKNPETVDFDIIC